MRKIFFFRNHARNLTGRLVPNLFCFLKHEVKANSLQLSFISASYFVSDFSRKMFLMLHSINWPNMIVRLPSLLEMLDNMYCTISFPGCNVINFEINLTFLTKLLLYKVQIFCERKELLG